MTSKHTLVENLKLSAREAERQKNATADGHDTGLESASMDETISDDELGAESKDGDGEKPFNRGLLRVILKLLIRQTGSTRHSRIF